MLDVIALIKEFDREEGRQEGKQEDEYQAKLATAQNLLNMGLNTEQIAQATELSFEDIQKIEREMQR